MSMICPNSCPASTGVVLGNDPPHPGFYAVSAKFAKLQYLDISNNQLAALPDAIKNIGSLRGLYLHGNDRLGLPNELLGPRRDEVLAEHTLARPSQILEYYFRVRRGRRPLNEAKLILVGRGAVGKTSIVNQLVHRRFHQGEKKTEGIQLHFPRTVASCDWRMRR